MENEILEYLEEYQTNRKDNLFETIYHGWLKFLEFPDSPVSLYAFLTETFKDININPLNEELGGKTKEPIEDFKHKNYHYVCAVTKQDMINSDDLKSYLKEIFNEQD